MNFIRRLLGQTAQSPGRATRVRSSSHVTPSRDRPSPAPEPAAGVPDSGDAALAPVMEADAPPMEEARSESSPSADDSAGRDLVPDAKTESAKAKASAAPGKGRVALAREPQPTPPRPPQPQPQPRFRGALAYGIASDVGLVRENNEDACIGLQWHSITVDDKPDFGLFAVADGMGGHLDGERAAGVAVQTLAAEMLERVYMPMLRDSDTGESPAILEALLSASEQANLAVMRQVPGGGTTLSAVAIVGNLAYLAHVGDSRAYLIHGERIEQLTTDHTLVQRLIEMKELTPEEAESYPQKNVLYRAMGQNEDLKMERMIRALPPASQVLLCSDGLWDAVDEPSIKRTVDSAPSPQQACDRLVQIANERGGHDNISVIVLRAPGPPDPKPSS